ncbi:ATP-grasp fold amidoligase family protein [Blastococcus saxobsidens]|uniref:Teichuronopeptide biosynthesis TupA-like protein n=1 Tax=Blastococcus saxobsidens TaxID=138336 RepID=A0A4Q7YB67_9ACTN|nr:ATP-grasp fold amidoligase family protein [Blastococcus saxobsidens]RZU34108.1 teichuronopeptide biosynthesis TupA-like protein [Blastococcus saxobsidens]
MPRSGFNTTLRKSLRPVHRTIASLLPLPARRRYLYLAGHGRLPRLNDPRLFTEKINWRIVHDRRPELAWTCDKLAMKDYAIGLHRETGLEVPETLWAGDDLGAVLGRTFDRPWVLKPNHRSGLVRFGAASEAVDADMVESTRTWLQDDQSVLLGEWAYSQARRLHLIEEDLAAGEPLDDYKFFVFGGKVVLIQVDRGRFTSGHARTFYTVDWQPAPVADIMPIGEQAPPPEDLDAMVHAAETLGRPYDFMRVDLYSTRGKVWLGELTPYPAGGTIQYHPREFDLYLGEQWALPPLGAVPGRGRHGT